MNSTFRCRSLAGDGSVGLGIVAGVLWLSLSMLVRLLLVDGCVSMESFGRRTASSWRGKNLVTCWLRDPCWSLSPNVEIHCAGLPLLVKWQLRLSGFNHTYSLQLCALQVFVEIHFMLIPIQLCANSAESRLMPDIRSWFSMC
jgi:hypothetical protein